MSAVACAGALERRKGRFEQAHGGTLFLDEIGDLPAEVQIALLRVLQERRFERLGGTQSIGVDVRVITATNRDLAEEVRAGRFRSDLFYRLNVFPIRMPALRDRREDIAPLVAHFAAKYGARFGRGITRIDRRSMKALESYAWPGNVRELENIIERAVILARDGILRVDLDELPGWSAAGNMPADLLAREREAIQLALRNSAGRVSGPRGAAVSLGVPASGLLNLESNGWELTNFDIDQSPTDFHSFELSRASSSRRITLVAWAAVTAKAALPKMASRTLA